jgi:hypothetical protein
MRVATTDLTCETEMEFCIRHKLPPRVWSLTSDVDGRLEYGMHAVRYGGAGPIIRSKTNAVSGMSAKEIADTMADHEPRMPMLCDPRTFRYFRKDATEIDRDHYEVDLGRGKFLEVYITPRKRK